MTSMKWRVDYGHETIRGAGNTILSVNIKFTDDDWERLGRDWSAWWAGELDRPMVMLEDMNLLLSRDGAEFTRHFLLEKPVDEVLDHYQALLEKIAFRGDSWPKWTPYFGPGIMAGFLGAKVMSAPEERTIWFEPDKSTPMEELNFQYDPENTWWKRVKDLTRAAVDRWDGRVSVGHTDLGGVLDILASFRTTEQLLYDVVESPDEVARLGNQLAALWNRYYDELRDIILPGGRGSSNWAAVWSPNRTYMHQCDFCYMISPEMFEKFVLPDLEACFSNMEHAFYHLDGKGQIAHLDMLLGMDNLKGIQWIPGAGQPQAEKWPQLLKRVVDAGKLCQVYVTQDGAREIVRQIGGKGFAFYIVQIPKMSPQEIDDFLDEMSA